MNTQISSLAMIRFRTVVVSIILFALFLSGCFDSSTEKAPPSLNGSSDTPKPGSDGPTARDDTLSVPVNISGVVDALYNDSASDGGTLTVTTFDAVGSNGGSISDNLDGTFTYTPSGGYEGEDTFTYTIKDASNKTSTATVVVTVSSAVIPNGEAYYAANCAICHSAGTDDQTFAFNATNLAQSTNPLTRDLSVYGGIYQLMGSFYDVQQKNLDELKAYLSTL